MNLLEVRVKPGSKKGPLVQPALDGGLLVHVREPAVDGKANQAVVGLLAKYFDVPKNNVQMVAGYKSKIKHFKIIGR